MRSLFVSAGVVMAMVTASSGCGLLPGQGASPPAAESPQDAEPKKDTEPKKDAEQQDSDGRAVTTDPATVLAKATYDSPFQEQGKVDVAVHSLTRRGKLVDLVFSLTPRLPSGVEPKERKVSPYDIVGDKSFEVTLIDTVNLKRHMVVKDSAGKELKPDDVWTNILVGQQLVMTYTFAAPPENVTSMDVHVSDWAPFRDVPVSS
ncbi:hypothetical protein [Thermoactinospora rubra]|uniref:hypothetical protein n=1 Tax=Thermoactinospora rubra TaxID=1088767 RepID=UPI001180F2FE|nr:hypothetical protein [Thermoactinospora rubra]